MEIKIYVIRDSSAPDFDYLDEDNFEETLDHIEEQGDVYSLEGFIKAFNNQEVSTFTDTIFKVGL